MRRLSPGFALHSILDSDPTLSLTHPRPADAGSWSLMPRPTPPFLMMMMTTTLKTLMDLVGMMTWVTRRSSSRWALSRH